MKHFFFLTLFIIAVVAIGWRYLPQQIREKASALVATALGRNSGDVERFLRESVRSKVLPQSPEKRREKATQELKKYVGELKKRISARSSKDMSPVNEEGGVFAAVGDDPGSASVEALIGASERLIEELEDANGDKSLGAEIRERVWDAVLPGKKESTACSVP